MDGGGTDGCQLGDSGLDIKDVGMSAEKSLRKDMKGQWWREVFYVYMYVYCLSSKCKRFVPFIHETFVYVFVCFFVCSLSYAKPILSPRRHMGSCLGVITTIAQTFGLMRATCAFGTKRPGRSSHPCWASIGVYEIV